MYNMILVDDEAIIRDGISSCIPWGSNGFNLAAVFEHGTAALEYIEQHPVDVVLSDINMPRMNGLKLSRILGERFPQITVLLLSGYDDFEYAQEAVRNQVREFLLKPITQSELGEVLLTIRAELDQKEEARKEHKILLEKLDQSFPILKERFFYRLISGRINSESINSRKDFFAWEDLSAYYQLVLINYPSDWSDLERLSLSEYLSDQVQSCDEVFYNPMEDLVLLLQDKDQETLEQRSVDLAERAFHYISRLNKKLISVGCGEIVGRLDQLERSYRSAVNVVEYSRIMGLTHILSVKDIRNREQLSPEGFTEQCKRVLKGLKEGGRKSAMEALGELVGYLESHFLKGYELRDGFLNLYYMLKAFIHEMDLYSDDPVCFRTAPDTFDSLEKSSDFLEKMIRGIDEQIIHRRKDMLLSRIDKARAIIGERFRESHFSLQDICDELYLSTSQFSLLFKEGTGQTFVEYLTARRIDEAKKLLSTTDLKGYEVAEKVGYTDPRYFTIIFKKQTGMTAMGYRRSRQE
ncbi:MAG: hypothetical protein B6241_13675 [Spirochaetaceae bacterium 4572_59]|nr:MAG: hypothetical protein B6241_13675 [Spirochaetaceae bacterium 4572_59]